MPNITVIADTSSLIVLSKIEGIELLRKLYQEVYITELKSYIEKLKAVGFRLSSKIEDEILRKSGEK